MSEPRAVVVGVGLRSPDGRTARQVVAASRVGTTLLRSSGLGSVISEDLLLSATPFLPDDLVGLDRLAELAAPALAEAFEGPEPADEQVPLLLVIAPKPEAAGGGTVPPPADSGELVTNAPPPARDPFEVSEEKPVDLEALLEDPDAGQAFTPKPPVLRGRPELITALAERSGVPIDRARSRLIEGGSGTFMRALEEACAMVNMPRGPKMAVVGAVDSHYDLHRLRRLDVEKRLFSVSENGRVVAGEGAAFVRIAAPSADRRAPALAELVSVEHLEVAQPEPRKPPEERLDEALAAPAPEKNKEPEPLEPFADLLYRVGVFEEWATWLVIDSNGEEEQEARWDDAFRAIKERAPDELQRLDRLEVAVGAERGDAGSALCATGLALTVSHMVLGTTPTNQAVIVTLHEPTIRGVAHVRAVPNWPVVRPLPDFVPAMRSPAHRPAAAAKRAIDRLLLAYRLEPKRWPLESRRDLANALVNLEQAAERCIFSGLDEPDHLRTMDALRNAVDAGIALAEQAFDADKEELTLPRTVKTALEPLRATLREARNRALTRQGAHVAAMRADDIPLLGTLSAGLPQVMPFDFRGRHSPGEEVPESDEDELDDLPEPVVKLFFSHDVVERSEGTTIEPVDDDTDRIDRVRAALDSIGRAHRLRKAEDVLPWSEGIGEFDDIIINQLDSLYALSQPRLTATRSAPDPDAYDIWRVMDESLSVLTVDPDLAFARTLVLGCTAGPSAAGWIVSGLRRADDATLVSCTDALRLASSPEVESVAQRLCLESRPELIRAGLEAMRARGATRVAWVAPLLGHPDRGVRVAAARALGAAPEASRTAAVTALEAAFGHDRDDTVGVAIIESLLRLQAPYSQERMRRRVSEVKPESRRLFGRLVCLSGVGDDWPIVESLPLDAELCELWGWFGRPLAVGRLIEVLHRGDPDPLAAARSLQRITGAIPDEEASSPRLKPGELRAVSEAELVDDPAQWRTYWDKHGGEFKATQKIRFGQPYDPNHSLIELLELSWSRERALAAMEYELATGDRLPDVEDWVAKQTTAIRSRLAKRQQHDDVT